MHETLVFNILGRARIQKLHGRDHYVVPAVIMTEGVHTGDEGPFLYLEEDIQNSVDSWDHMPVVIYHPKTQKKARHPEVLNTQGCGLVLNSRWDKKIKKHRVEVWFDAARTQEVDDLLKTTVLADVKNGKMIACSTGVGISYQDNAGVWKTGETYKGIARNFKPDHLAILPGQEGACKDAFINVNNEAASKDIRDKLASKLGEKDTANWKGYVDTVLHDCIIFNHNGELNRIEYALDDGGKVVLEGEPEKITKEVTYKVLNNKPIVSDLPDPEPVKKDNEMDKKAFIDLLIQNSKGKYTEEDREELMKMDEKTLKKLEINNVNPTPPPAPPTPPPAPEQIDINKLLTGLTREQREALMPDDVKRFVQNKRKEEEVEKTQYVELLVAHSKCPFTKEFLEQKEVSELKGMYGMLPPDDEELPVGTDPNTIPMFKAAAGAPIHNQRGQKKVEISVIEPPDHPSEWNVSQADVDDKSKKVVAG